MDQREIIFECGTIRGRQDIVRSRIIGCVFVGALFAVFIAIATTFTLSHYELIRRPTVPATLLILSALLWPVGAAIFYWWDRSYENKKRMYFTSEKLRYQNREWKLADIKAIRSDQSLNVSERAARHEPNTKSLSKRGFQAKPAHGLTNDNTFQLELLNGDTFSFTGISKIFPMNDIWRLFQELKRTDPRIEIPQR